MADPPVFVITGPSGAGKGTLVSELLRRLPDRLELAVSATTRARRTGEQDGREYWFVSTDEFDRRVRDDEFLEWVTFVSGQRYGTPRREIERIRARGRAPVLELEIEGAKAVRDEVPGSVVVFVDAPLPELERRLRERATEAGGEIGDRVAFARRQKEQRDDFDYVVDNEELARAVEQLVAIVSERLNAPATICRR